MKHMKASELRIGNWVQYDCFDEIIYTKIDAIKDSKVSLNLSTHGYEWEDVEDIDPIPLTPEILEKAGFIRDDWSNSNYPGRFSLSLIDTGNYTGDGYFKYDSADDCLALYSSDGGDTSIVIHKIEYVHQLQNIYFAITGEELEIESFSRL